MTTPFIVRDWDNPPALPADAEGMLDLTVRDLIAIMQDQDATNYTFADDGAEFTLAMCVGSKHGQLAAAAQKLYIAHSLKTHVAADA